MKYTLFNILVFATLASLTSCQKEVDGSLPNGADSTAHGYRLATYKNENFGPLIHDTTMATFTYYDSLPRLKVTYRYADNPSSVDSLVQLYDSVGKLLTNNRYENNNNYFTSQFSRLSGLLQLTTYHDAGVPPNYFMGSFSHGTDGGSPTVTFDDRGYVTNAGNNYYTVTLDAAGNMLRKAYNMNKDIIDFTYDNSSQLTATTEVFRDTIAGVITADSTWTTYQRDPNGNNVLYDSYKNGNGTDLSWFEHDKYFGDFLFDDGLDYKYTIYFNLGKPCTQVVVHNKEYTNGSVTDETQTTLHYTLVYDANRNLLSYTEMALGVTLAKWTFTYQSY